MRLINAAFIGYLQKVNIGELILRTKSVFLYGEAKKRAGRGLFGRVYGFDRVS